MKIAAVTVSYNEDYQLTAFKQHYQQCAMQLYKHVIVDNGSELDYISRLRKEFPNSEIITKLENGGTTAAFNVGIKSALADSAVDYILLMVQDVELAPAFLPRLTQVLSSDPAIAAAGGVVFSSGTKDLVESYGGIMNWDNFILQNHFNGAVGTAKLPDSKDVDFIPGGATLVKREVYEKIGLQDEQLFMYCDEFDWIYRVKKSGYRLVVDKLAQAWHQHNAVISPRSRELRANFYTSRNRVYLIGKHHGQRRKLRYWANSIAPLVVNFVYTLYRKQRVNDAVVAQILGLSYGVVGLMGRRLYIEE